MSLTYVNTILDAVKTVFISMLDMPVAFQNPTLKTAPHPTYEISSIIKISGQLDHWIILSFPEKTAKLIASEMLGETIGEINDLMIDVIGEITNMVVGVADTLLEIEDVTYSLPAVTQEYNQIAYPENSFIFSMPCVMASGTFEVDIALTEGFIA